MTRAAIVGIFATGMMAGLSAGCGNEEVEIGRSGTGAATGAGGAMGSGGVTGMGGAVQLGGATGIGGATGTGGATQQGGATGVGGSVMGTGGAAPIGGKTETGSGGAGGTTVGSGGTTAAGGKTGTGGATGTECGSSAGITCTRTGQFCEATDGTCGISGDARGLCVDMPEVCAAVYAPVCGCDGNTYSNDCIRRGAGVSKNHGGQCQTADAGVRDAASQPDTPADTDRDGPLAIMTPTLPAPCTTDADCCVAMDICMATAYLVGKAEFEAMVASLESVHVPYTSTCLSCLLPSVQVQCQAGVCAGEELPYSSERTALLKSHCGTLSINASDGGAMSRTSAFFATKWGCAN